MIDIFLGGIIASLVVASLIAAITYKVKGNQKAVAVRAALFALFLLLVYVPLRFAYLSQSPVSSVTVIPTLTPTKIVPTSSFTAIGSEGVINILPSDIPGYLPEVVSNLSEEMLIAKCDWLLSLSFPDSTEEVASLLNISEGGLRVQYAKCLHDDGTIVDIVERVQIPFLKRRLYTLSVPQNGCIDVDSSTETIYAESEDDVIRIHTEITRVYSGSVRAEAATYRLWCDETRPNEMFHIWEEITPHSN